MRQAQHTLEALLGQNEPTVGMSVRVHGENLILSRAEAGRDEEPEQIDRVRLTRLSASRWGLAVKRHTGRWERTPFHGSMREMVEALCTFMQHLVAPY